MGQEFSTSQPLSDPDDPYIYSPLVGGTSFRTIEVLPARTADPLRCRIHHHSSISATTYKALSYAWGDPALIYSMFIGEKELRITANVHSALVHLRDEKEPQTFWVDAICINQKDVNEKQGQIRLMRQIYQKARRVLVYLGEAADNSQKVDELMVDISIIVFGRESKLPDEEYEKCGLPARSHPDWRAFHHLFRRPWFTRCWVIQEVVLGRKVDLVCGEWVQPFKVFANFMYKAAICNMPTMDMSRQDYDFGLGQLMRISQLLHSGVNSWKLIHLLILLRLAQASDGHDYIYSVLGISKDANDPRLRIDYIESVENTFLRFAKYFVAEGDGILLLHYSYLKFAESKLPSWVPNWASKDSGMSTLAPDPLWHGRDQFFSAAGASQASIRLLPSSDCIVVRGIIFDDLSKVGKIYKEDSRDQTLGGRFCKVQACMEELDSLSASSRQFLTGEDLFDVKWRTLLCNISTAVFREFEPPEEYAQGFKALKILVDGLNYRLTKPMSVEEGNLYVEQARGPADESMQWCYSKRRAVTKTGYLAQVPLEATTRDIIVVVLGANVPFVLRPLTSGGYTLVGECYCHGIMYGEILKMANVEYKDIVIQ
jgi:hypothetical protein